MLTKVQISNFKCIELIEGIYSAPIFREVPLSDRLLGAGLTTASFIQVTAATLHSPFPPEVLSHA